MVVLVSILLYIPKNYWDPQRSFVYVGYRFWYLIILEIKTDLKMYSFSNNKTIAFLCE